MYKLHEIGVPCDKKCPHSTPRLLRGKNCMASSPHALVS